MGSYLAPSPVCTAASDFPELCIEWLPTQGPFAADGEWCDITAYVASGSVSRGRQYELNQFQAGTCSLTLRTTTRSFDPDNSASAFYPWLVPMRQVRISAVWNGTRYPVFRGYITDWGQTTPADKLFETTIEAKDAFALLEGIELPSSAWAMTAEATTPTAWFRMNETGTTRMTDSTNSGFYGVFDNCEQGVAGLVAGDADYACGFAHTAKERAYIQGSPLTTFPFAVSAMVKCDNQDIYGYKVIFAGYATSVLRIVVGVRDDSTGAGQIQARVASTGGTRDYISDIAIDDNEPHHVLVMFTSGSSFTIYVDGVDVTGAALVTGTATFPTDINKWTIGNTPDLASGDFGFGSNIGGDITRAVRGTIDEVVLWNNTTVSASTVADLAAAAKLAWEGDDTGTRVTRILDAIGWPTTLRDISTGVSVLMTASWNAGESALKVLQNIANTEFGQFFIGTDGSIIWRSRHYPYLTSRSMTSQATFGDAHSAASLKYTNCDLKRDEALIRNPVQAARRNGVTAVAKDSTYLEKYGTRRWSAPASDDQRDAAMQDRAQWMLSRFKELTTRLFSLAIAPRSDTNLWTKALGLEIGDRITVKRTPLGLNNEIVVDQIIEGITHSFSPKAWTTTYRGSPTDPNVNTVLILDDVTYGVLDTYRLAY